MNNVIFKTVLLKGAKGDQGNIGAGDSVPTNGVIAYDGEGIPEGYAQVLAPEGMGDSLITYEAAGNNADDTVDEIEEEYDVN